MVVAVSLIKIIPVCVRERDRESANIFSSVDDLKPMNRSKFIILGVFFVFSSLLFGIVNFESGL